MRNSAVFIDTFHWIAEINQRDEFHDRCVSAREGLRGRRLVTSEEVLSELLDFLSGYGPLMRAAAVLTIRAIVEDPSILVVEQSHASFDAALDLYDRRPDKRYSMTDCSSMSLLKSRGILDVLTNDRHFEQEGFKALLSD